MSNLSFRCVHAYSSFLVLVQRHADRRPFFRQDDSEVRILARTCTFPPLEYERESSKKEEELHCLCSANSPGAMIYNSQRPASVHLIYNHMHRAGRRSCVRLTTAFRSAPVAMVMPRASREWKSRSDVITRLEKTSRVNTCPWSLRRKIEGAC